MPYLIRISFLIKQGKKKFSIFSNRVLKGMLGLYVSQRLRLWWQPSLKTLLCDLCSFAAGLHAEFTWYLLLLLVDFLNRREQGNFLKFWLEYWMTIEDNHVILLSIGFPVVISILLCVDMRLFGRQEIWRKSVEFYWSPSCRIWIKSYFCLDLYVSIYNLSSSWCL